MKAIHLTAYGNPAQNLKMVEVSEPDAPSGGDALVRMEYAPIDYSDLLLANGVYFLDPKLPSVIGGEGAGIVEASLPERWLSSVSLDLTSHQHQTTGKTANLFKRLLEGKESQPWLI